MPRLHIHTQLMTRDSLLKDWSKYKEERRAEHSPDCHIHNICLEIPKSKFMLCTLKKKLASLLLNSEFLPVRQCVSASDIT